MCHELPRGPDFWSFILAVDQDLAESRRQLGCRCGGRLHSANYPRSPRGCPDELPDQYRYRLSFCCDCDGCRKRATPPSVRFLGRKVYLAAIVVLVAAMRHGASARRAGELSKLVGADRRTIDRWRIFWQEVFPQTQFWKMARGRLSSTADLAAGVLPLPLLEAFVRDAKSREQWGNLLRFLSPISITGGLMLKLS
jgi:hypothetical protein